MCSNFLMKRIACICFTSVISTQQDNFKIFESKNKKIWKRSRYIWAYCLWMLFCKVSLSFHFDKDIWQVKTRPTEEEVAPVAALTKESWVHATFMLDFYASGVWKESFKIICLPYNKGFCLCVFLMYFCGGIFQFFLHKCIYIHIYTNILSH